jgi:hypothetical protein
VPIPCSAGAGKAAAGDTAYLPFCLVRRFDCYNLADLFPTRNYKPSIPHYRNADMEIEAERMTAGYRSYSSPAPLWFVVRFTMAQDIQNMSANLAKILMLRPKILMSKGPGAEWPDEPDEVDRPDLRPPYTHHSPRLRHLEIARDFRYREGVFCCTTLMTHLGR